MCVTDEEALVRSPMEVEARFLFLAISLVVNLDIRKVIFEIDCLELFQACTGKSRWRIDDMVTGFRILVLTLIMYCSSGFRDHLTS